MIKTISILKALLASLFIALVLPAVAQSTERIAPGFTLSDLNGNKVSLSDFKGKVIYLDIWASWCGPCLAEIPDSKKLQEQFKDSSSIAFVNISIDHDTLQWKKKIESKQMTGIQLLSPRGRESDLIKNYEVTTIPRFIIIDKNGLIREYFAKRPSEKGLAKYLTKMLEE